MPCLGLLANDSLACLVWAWLWGGDLNVCMRMPWGACPMACAASPHARVALTLSFSLGPFPFEDPHEDVCLGLGMPCVRAVLKGGRSYPLGWILGRLVAHRVNPNMVLCLVAAIARPIYMCIDPSLPNMWCIPICIGDLQRCPSAFASD